VLIKTDALSLSHYETFCFTALHGMPSRSDKNGVCLYVRVSVKRVHCDKMEEKSVQIFIPCERSFSLVFWEGEWLVGGDPFYLKFWVSQPLLEQNRAPTGISVDFWFIFAHSASAVTPSEKSLINTNRRSTMHFPMSPRWTSYVVSKPPKGVLKNAKCPKFEQ